jgi:F-box domain
LDHLPDDAIEIIAAHLPIPALFQFSLTCKSIAKVALSERQFERRLLTSYAVDIKVCLFVFSPKPPLI